jgi:hypothetical protein
MNITVDFDYIEDKKPREMEHICVTDGYFFRSGIWHDGYFIPDPDKPFEFIFWTTTGEK